MTECSAQLCLGFHPQLAVRLAFDAPEVSSDGGVVLLRQVDEQLGLTAGFAGCLPDERDPVRVVHSRHEQSRQRIFQIALGYEDCNDADALRRDPLLKTVCDRTPDDPEGLSSQPTLSRFENAPDGVTLRRLVRWLESFGVTHLGLTFHFGGIDHAAALRAIELWARAVATAPSPLPPLPSQGRGESFTKNADARG